MVNASIVKALVLTLDREFRSKMHDELRAGTAYFQYARPSLKYEFTLLSRFSGKISGGYCFSLSRGWLSSLRHSGEVEPDSIAQRFNELQQSVLKINADLIQAFDESHRSVVTTSLYLPQERPDLPVFSEENGDYPVIIPLSCNGHRASLSCGFG